MLDLIKALEKSIAFDRIIKISNIDSAIQLNDILMEIDEEYHINVNGV